MPLNPLRAALFGSGLAAATAVLVLPAFAAPERPVLLAQLSDSDLAVRVNQLEGENRRLTGQIEELQHRIQILQDRLGQASAGPAAAPRDRAPDGDHAPDRGGPGLRGGSVHDEAGASPGTTPGSGGNADNTVRGPGAPLVIAPNLGGPGGPSSPSGHLELPRGNGILAPETPSDRPNRRAGNPALTAPPTNQPGDSYALAKGYLERRDYDDAELQFKDFLSSFPHDRLVGDALYGLGESYYMRKRYNDALEPFLKLVTDHADSPRAPDAMLRLGQTLNAIDQKSQACATFNAIAKKFPRAGAVKAKAQREMKTDGC